jgi:predicted MFS family arabinose efflux permease
MSESGGKGSLGPRPPRLAADRPATYREVFAVREFTALFTAYVLSVAGDQLARVAVALLVLDRTGSQFWSAVSLGIGYLPWVLGGPLLSALGDRFAARHVMIACDVTRALLVGAIAWPGIPLWLLVSLLFLAACFAPAFSAARAASLPDILQGDRYVLGTSLSRIAHQLAQVSGFLAGGLLVKQASIRGAILIDAATFALSAALISLFMQHRTRAGLARSGSLLGEGLEGLRLTLGNGLLTRYMVLGWVGAAFLAAPEGLMPTYARRLGGDEVVVGLLFAAIPLGAVLGLAGYARLVPPRRRRRQIGSLALASLLGLVPVALDPSLPVLLGLLMFCGAASAFQVDLNAAFVRAVPPEFRARAFGVATGGLQVVQGVAIAVSGALADRFEPPLVVGACGLVGVAGAWAALRGWPTEREMEEATVHSALATSHSL